MDQHKLKVMMLPLAVLLVTSIWLVWTRRVWDSAGSFLFAGEIALFIWFLIGSKQPSSLAQFLIKSFVISYVITSIVFFVSLGSQLLVYFVFLGLWLVYVVLPRSLLPVAISVVVYGIFRTKLRSWEIFLSSWYMLIFAVQAAYWVWWTLFVQPYLHDYYQSGAGATALDILLMFVAFLIAGVFSLVYVIVKGLKEEPPP